MALIALLAAVAVPESVGSQGPSPVIPLDATFFQGVDAASIEGTAATIPHLDPAYRSSGALSDNSVLLDPDQRPAPAGRPDAAAIQPDAPVGSIAIPQWHFDGNISWYGPGFYGKRTACGYAMSQTLVGVPGRVEADIIETEPIFSWQFGVLQRAHGMPPRLESFASSGSPILPATP